MNYKILFRKYYFYKALKYYLNNFLKIKIISIYNFFSIYKTDDYKKN